MIGFQKDVCFSALFAFLKCPVFSAVPMADDDDGEGDDDGDDDDIDWGEGVKVVMRRGG